MGWAVQTMLLSCGIKGTIDTPAVVQRWEVVLDGAEGITSWLTTAGLPMSPEGPARDEWRGIASPSSNLLAAGDRGGWNTGGAALL